MDGDDGGVAWTAVTAGNVAVTPLRPELLGLRGVGVVDIFNWGLVATGDLRTQDNVAHEIGYFNDGRYSCCSGRIPRTLAAANLYNTGKEWCEFIQS